MSTSTGAPSESLFPEPAAPDQDLSEPDQDLSEPGLGVSAATETAAPNEWPASLDERSRGDGVRAVLREWGPVLFAAVVIAVCTRLFLVQAYHIPSPSMVPTLENGDRVLVNRLSYQFGEVERGQVVVFEKPPSIDGENDLIKRVIGLPGETLRIIDSQVFIGDLLVQESYLREQNSTLPKGGAIPGCAQDTQSATVCVIPDGHVFVMGDNRRGSTDSRVFGPISVETIVGRATIIVWPIPDIARL